MRFLVLFSILLLLQACKHPLAIEGEGDIIERLAGHRGCTLEEFQANSARCTENEVVDEDYLVNYEAVPKPGWTFLGWEGTACSAASVAPYCDYNVTAAWVTLWDATVPNFVFPPTVAVFGQPDTWTTRAETNAGGVGLGTCTIDGKLYLMGMGWETPGSTVKSEVYDPATNIWSRLADFPTRRGWVTASAVGGKCYVIGGGSVPFQPTLTTVAEYDPQTNSWRSRAPLPAGRSSAGSVAVNGKIYVIGGGDTLWWSTKPLSPVAIYDPATDKWSQGADMPTPRSGLAVAAIDGLIYTVGGSDYDAGLTSDDSVEVYDPRTDQWTTRSDLPVKRTYMKAGVVDGQLYAFGGMVDDGDTTSAAVYRYDPASDQWVRKADMSVARYGMGGTTLNGKIYVVAGRELRESTPLKLTEEYSP
jgi:N-acetylneuraminic acid mutarotase